MLLGQVLVKVYSVIPMTFVEFMQNVGGGLACTGHPCGDHAWSCVTWLF